MSSTPLNLEPLRNLASQGFNVGVLALMEMRVMQQAIAERELAGYTAHSGDEVRAHALRLLPKDAHLYQAYNETQASMRRQPVQDLEEVGRNLQMCAQQLERAAARALASIKDMAVGDKMPHFRVVAERYAELLEAARTLESSGVVSVAGQQGRIANLTGRPTGPLAEFFDKASSILAERQAGEAQRPRMRMAA